MNKPPEQFNLDMDATQLALMMSAITAAAERFMNNLGSAPTGPSDESIRDFLGSRETRSAFSEHGESLSELIEILEQTASVDLNSASGKSLTAIPGTGLVSSAAATFLGQVMNRFSGVAFAGPGTVALEADVVRWVIGLMGLPATAGGVITSGGSISILSAIVAARTKLLGEHFFDGVIYCTDQTHFALKKALRILGFPATALRLVGRDEELCMDGNDLLRTIRKDRERGYRPFCIAANAGATNFGTVDRLPLLADIANDEGLWLHTDAAYGGFFQLTDRGKKRLDGIERSDSIVLDAHKSLFLPYSSSFLLVRDESALIEGHRMPTATYLEDMSHSVPGGDDLPNFADLGPELTRPARGIAIWFPLKLHGVSAFRKALDEKLDLAQYLWKRLREFSEFEVHERPHLSIVGFRCKLEAASLEDENQATRGLIASINSDRQHAIGITTIDGKVYARVAIVSARTTRTMLDELLEKVEARVRTLACV